MATDNGHAPGLMNQENRDGGIKFQTILPVPVNRVAFDPLENRQQKNFAVSRRSKMYFSGLPYHVSTL